MQFRRRAKRPTESYPYRTSAVPPDQKQPPTRMMARAVYDGQNARNELYPAGVEPAGRMPGLLQRVGLRLSDGGHRAAGLTGSDGVTAERRGLEQWELPRQDVVAIDP